MMENLSQIETIAKKIKTASAASIRALHNFNFQIDGDRTNRKRLREFKGFAFRADSDEYAAKVEYVRGLTIGDLISCCNILGLDYGGNKEELITRICNGLMDLNSLIGNDDDDDDADESENQPGENDSDDQASGISHDERNNVRFAVSFKDVEDSIRTFDGGNTYPVERWITEFEEAAILFGWSELQKVIFAKRSLTGLAKLFIQSEGVVKTWTKLKTILRDEFAAKINSAQLHETLAKRKMRREETVQEYYLHMKELASRGRIEDDALIQYVIDGIVDNDSNKLVLYGAKKIQDFKERLKIYENLRKRNQEKFKTIGRKDDPTRKKEFSWKPDTSRKTETQGQKKELLCFNCGEKGHISRDCNSKALGRRCFKCKAFGHISADCASSRDGKSSVQLRPSVNSIATTPMSSMCKQVSIDDININALIDTGSQVSIVREFIYRKIGQRDLRKSEISLSGFGKNEINTLGYFQTVICIDEDMFPCTIYVVPDSVMSIDAVIGSDILNLAEVKINVNGITIQKTNPTIFLSQINAIDVNELDIGQHVAKRYKDDVKKLVSSYKPEKTKSADVEMNIIVKEEQPIFSRPRRLPVIERDIVDKQVEDWIMEGIVEPCVSEYASQVIVVKKKDGSPRICIDYRRINRIILKQKSPIDDQFHPVYYMSKKTTPAERKYSSYELEVLAVIEALKRFRVYLLGIRFKIITDCQAFQKTMDKKDLATRVARWALLLEEYNYAIEHRSGSKMRHVDALSRYPVMYIVADSLTSRMRNAQQEDDDIRTIKELLKVRPHNDYFIRDDILYKFVKERELLVVPKKMQNELIRHAHEKGHFAVKKTEEILKQEYYIPKLSQKVERFISNCIACILVNRKVGKQEGLLHPLFKEDVPLHTYHMDHLGPLESTSKKYKHILAIIDGFTKFVWLYPTKSTTAAEVINKIEVQKSVFGNPSHIITDRGTAFTATEFDEYCQKENIKHSTITTGLPRANGQVERLNRIIISALAKLSLDDPSKWYKNVNDVQRAINSTYQRCIKTTPFELLVGVKFRGTTDAKLKEIIDEEIIENFENDRDELRLEAKKQILKVQDENKKTYNLRRRHCNKYKIGDLVAIKRTQLGSGLKLKPKYLGPYIITKAKGRDTYDVRKDGTQEGPIVTSTCAEYMKLWNKDGSSSETDD